MNNVKIIKGDLIELALKSEFDVIAHGCNCFCTQKGDFNKLGTIDYKPKKLINSDKILYIVNAYTQFFYGKVIKESYGLPLDYEALTLCLKKINYNFKTRHIGLPWIGCGLAGGDKKRVLEIIKNELKDCKVTIVEYEKKTI